MFKKIKLKLQVPNGLSIIGTVPCCERKESEYLINHYKFSGPQYEINVTPILSQIISEKSANSFFEKESEDFKKEKRRREELVNGRHIQVGKDLQPYMCCPNLPEAYLTVVTKLWLAHQVLFAGTKHDIGYFECFLKAGNPNFEDWLENNPSMKDVPTEEKDFILSDKALYIKAKELYEQEKRADGEKRQFVDYLADSILKMLNATVAIELS